MESIEAPVMELSQPQAIGGAAGPLLEIRGLQVVARAEGRDKVIVKGIDLSIDYGECFGLIGESGAGKSTIGAAAMAHVKDGCRIASGEILFKGQNLLRIPPRALNKLRGTKITYVAQSAIAAFNPAYRLMDQCIETTLRSGVPKAEARARAIAVFRQMRLPDPESIGQRFAHQLSGGQLQRVMVAMAMIPQPDLIIFDEPTTALDVTTQLDVLAIIRDAIRSQKTAAIYVSHDLALVAQIADRIMVLRHGETVEVGRTKHVLQSPEKPYTAELLAARTHKAVQADPVRGQGPPLLELRGVCASYGKSIILKNISFPVYPATTVALIGESGSGKSTVARLIAGLLPPTDGTILWNGCPMSARYAKRRREELRDIQVVHQNPDSALNPKQRVGEIIGRPVEFYRRVGVPERDRRVRELLDLMQLDSASFYDRYPGDLSGGQKQRVCIARALAAEPRLVICDEITSALDVLVAGEILKLLQDVQLQSNLAFLFITHDIGLVRHYSDSIVVLKKGEVVEHGPRADLLTPPHHPYTKSLLLSEPEMRTDWLDEVLLAPPHVSAKTPPIIKSA